MALVAVEDALAAQLADLCRQSAAVDLEVIGERLTVEGDIEGGAAVLPSAITVYLRSKDNTRAPRQPSMRESASSPMPKKRGQSFAIFKNFSCFLRFVENSTEFLPLAY